MQTLEPGDFVYQSDIELFLVLMNVSDGTYNFAVHGWREIDENRLEEYIDHQNGKLYKQEQIEEVVESDGSDEEKQSFEKLKQLFELYEDVDLEERGPHTDFTLEDTAE